MRLYLKVFLLCISVALLPSCIASSKHVKQLDKIVEAQAGQIDQIINVINEKGLLTIEQADAMTKNSTMILKASHDQANETSSIFTWKIFTWAGFKIALEIVGKSAADFVSGNWKGIATTVIGIATTYFIKNRQAITALAENDNWHKEDKVKLVAKVLTGEESTNKYNECKENACKIVEKHEG